MPKETKFTLYLLLFLGVAFGFVVWQKVSHQTDVLAAMKKKAGQIQDQFSGKHDGHEHHGHGHEHAPAPGSGGNPFDAKPIQTAQNPPQHNHNEPRKLPGNSQFEPSPFDEHDHSSRPNPPQFQPTQRENPFPSESTQVVTRKPPSDLFESPTQGAPKKNPFPQEDLTPKQNPFPQGGGTTVQTFPASQTKIVQQPNSNGKNPFDEDDAPKNLFPGATGQTEPKPTPPPGNNPFDNSFPMPQVPPSHVVQSPNTKSPFDEEVATTPKQPQPPAQFNPFEESNAVPTHQVNHPPVSSNPKDPFSAHAVDTQQPKGGFPPSNSGFHQAQHDPYLKPTGHKSNPFDDNKVAQIPDGNSSVVPAPKFHAPGPAKQPKSGGSFNPFDDNPLPTKPDKPAQPPVPEKPTNPFPPKYDPSDNHGPACPPSDKPTPVYKVQMDETYWSISEKLYGSIRYFNALAEYNRHRIPNPKHLRTGMIILVPEAEELERMYAKLIPGATKKNDPYCEIKSGLFFTNAGAPMYRVGDDDTLSDIAQKHLGRSTRWVEIYNLNREQLKTADRLKVGSILRLPRDASQVTVSAQPGYSR